MVNYILFLLGFGFFYFLLLRIMRKKQHGLAPLPLFFVFAGKVLAGCLYGWLFLNLYGGDDTWVTHADSLEEWQQMKISPLRFFVFEVDLVQYVKEMGLREGLPFFRMKLEKAIINKPLGLFNFYSQGNYYINVIAFSFISFWGFFWLYQVLCNLLPAWKKLHFLLLFFYPPALFWLSGIRSDAMLFFFFSLFIAQLYRTWNSSNNRGYWLALLAWGAMIVIKASFALLLLVPCFAWWLAEKRQIRMKPAFFGVTGIALVVFFLSALLPAPLNLPAGVARVQQDFFELKGNTRIDLPTLNDNPISYLRNLPAALDNILLRPYPWEAKGVLQYGMVIQNIFLICMAGIFFLRRFPGRGNLIIHPLLWALFFFSVSFYLSIGYTIPFPGATIRYRVIPETLLVWFLVMGSLRNTDSHYVFFNVYKKD